MITVSVVGATGYTGGEVLRILAAHPEFKVVAATSRADAGAELSSIWPALEGHYDLNLVEPSLDNIAGAELVFFATPNGTAMTQAPALIKAGKKVIDLAADFRLQDLQVWSEWYGPEHACPELVEQAVYGLSELNKTAISNASLVANPGCYPTAIVLGLLPLLEQQLINPKTIIADAKSGISGAGRGLSVGKLFGEVSGDFKSYAVTGHRHHPEISQALNQVSSAPTALTFVPHLVPMFRGMQATIYADLLPNKKNLRDIFHERYQNDPFVHIEPESSCPTTSSVKGSNQCRISLHVDKATGRVIVMSVIDNLVKGAAGQAVQNANLMCGFAEQTGLDSIALSP